MEQLSPVRPELIGVTRRQFLNRSVVGLAGLGLSGFTGSVLAFLWPRSGSGFGATMSLGTVDQVRATLQKATPHYVIAGRFYLVPYSESESGMLALFQRCTHLGCRVPFCQSSQWFECGCHASKYNLAGEWKAGPAPRGLDRFPVTIDRGQVEVDTGNLLVGPPHGTNTTGQEAAGPFCVEV